MNSPKHSTITFFHTDNCERQAISPIAEEAKRRGFIVRFSTDLGERAQIGVYCQHACRPNANFSIIMLHDLAQRHDIWPDFWSYEPWSAFDMGFVPGRAWVSRWQHHAARDVVQPKRGVFDIGWPKADLVWTDRTQFAAKSLELKQSLGLKHAQTVLYAPSWENDGKQDDFVRRLIDLPVNLLLKQAPWSDAYPQVHSEINRMNDLHRGLADNVHIVDPEVSIMYCIGISDVLVSDESSVLVEAALHGVPSVAVLDWTIPDRNPPRPACVPFDNVRKIERAELRRTIEDILADPAQARADAIELREFHFSHFGESSKLAVDLLEAALDGKSPPIAPLSIDGAQVDAAASARAARPSPLRGEATGPYRFNTTFGIHERVKAGGFAYSDGDQIENRIYAIIDQAKDISLGSDELVGHVNDWASHYHLSPLRANLMRPLETQLRGKSVLELGSGCGAISRYFAELGCSLTCVEGSHRRASITAARCRDADNVRVFNDNFQDFETEERFDVVTLIGVLEYSRAFIRGDDPIAAALELCRSFLKPDGVLIIAIENQLGLKYWAGAPEDHLGVPFLGLEGLYGEKTAVTFGQRKLRRLLRTAGFADDEFYYPFPDYKLPVLVLTDLADEADASISHNLLSSAFAPNQSSNYQRTLSEGATWRALVDNGLVGALANSFLIVAKKGHGNWARNTQDLAFGFSNGRRKSLSKEVHILQAGEEVLVRRKLQYGGTLPQALSFAPQEPLESGELLFNSLLPITNRDGWGVQDLAEWMRPLFMLLLQAGDNPDEPHVLPGRFFDATPFNAVGGKDGYRLFDLEWTPWDFVNLDHALFRGLFYSLARMGSVAAPRKGTPRGLVALASEVVKCLTGEPVDVDAYLEQESAFQQLVSLGSPSIAGFKSAQLDIRIQPTQLRHALDAAQEALARRPEGEGAETPALQQWIDGRVPDKTDGSLIEARLAENNGGPLIGIVIRDLDGDSAKLGATLTSLDFGKCLYANLRIVVLTVGPAANTSIEDKIHLVHVEPDGHVDMLNLVAMQSSWDWVLVVDAGDIFTRSGLLMAALSILDAPDLRAVYGDELRRTPSGDLGAAFRPGFNLDFLLSLPGTMARHWLVRRDALLQAGGFDAAFAEAMEFEMILRLIDVGGLAGLGHFDEALLTTDAPVLRENPSEQAALLRHLAGRGYTDAVVQSDLPGRYRIVYGHAQQPLVSIVVPVPDRLALLQRCVESVLEKTQYTHYEILIVDNHGTDADTAAWLAGVADMGSEQVRVLRTAQHVNYAALHNSAVAEARGEYVVMLASDTAIVRGEWIDGLLNHAQRPEVGVVGPKLLTADGRIQSAGLVLGLRGAAGSPFVGETMGSAGNQYRLEVDQDYSAVSGACLMVRKSLYEQIGGLDESEASSAFHEVDLCLRVRDAGWLTVWTPHAVVMRDDAGQKKGEGAPATNESEPSGDTALYARWLPLLARDPAYNRNLRLEGPGFEVEADRAFTWQPLSWRPLPVLLVHPADPFGCGNYRIIKPFEAMREKRIASGLSRSSLPSIVSLEQLRPDAVVFQRQLTDSQIAHMQRSKEFSSSFKVYELDDYLPNLPVRSIHKRDMPKDAFRSMRRALAYVDRFVVSTQPLADALRGTHPDIRVVQNRLPVDWWAGLAPLRRQGRKPRVGWAGGIGHTGDLELIADVVKALADEVEWVFFGMCPDRMRPYAHELHGGVEIDRYPAALAALSLDLAVAPLEDNIFNACKSNLRLLEYGACGIPVVCTDLVCYQGDLPVTRVKNRFIDWVEAIRMHTHDLDAAARAGDALRDAVRRDWMLSESHLVRWRDAWTGA